LSYLQPQKDVLVQLLRELLIHEIQYASYLSSCGLLSGLSGSCSRTGRPHYP